jgi:transaldolase
MTSSLHQLNELGQSVWLDSISRDWLEDGELARMIEELAVVGVTSNPTIFAQALTSSTYDADIARFADEGADDRTIFERLAVEDIRRTCDLLPATDAGLPAIEQILAEGINVNVTLLFAVSVYEAVMERYLRAMERRAEAGQSLDVASVASFFVSRVDTKVDALLDESQASLRGRAAVANAVAAWHAYQQVFTSERFLALEGARPQRPLWASTGTKNPDYSDILYVQELIVPGTVNTMPLTTMRAFADHGTAKITIADTAPALAFLGELAAAGVDLGAVTEQLRAEGVASFQASFDELLAGIEAKRSALARA